MDRLYSTEILANFTTLPSPSKSAVATSDQTAVGTLPTPLDDTTVASFMNYIGDPMLGITTAFHYYAAHPSTMNKTFVQGFKRISGGVRPDHVGLAVYDGMHLIYQALKTTSGDTNGDALIAAMKGMSWEAPQGLITIDPETRDIIQDVYIRRIERHDGELYNVEFEKYSAVKDPFQASPKK
jgi:branched-chain amino acid transport system substrate-binding protein